MPYALFCNEAKLSKAYPTEADVWKHAQQSGLVVDVVSEEEKPHPRPVLDNDYEIKACRPDPQEDPGQEPGRGRAGPSTGNSTGFVRGAQRVGDRKSPFGTRANGSGL